MPRVSPSADQDPFVTFDSSFVFNPELKNLDQAMNVIPYPEVTLLFRKLRIHFMELQDDTSLTLLNALEGCFDRLSSVAQERFVCSMHQRFHSLESQVEYFYSFCSSHLPSQGLFSQEYLSNLFDGLNSRPRSSNPSTSDSITTILDLFNDVNPLKAPETVSLKKAEATISFLNQPESASAMKKTFYPGPYVPKSNGRSAEVLQQFKAKILEEGLSSPLGDLTVSANIAVTDQTVPAVAGQVASTSKPVLVAIFDAVLYITPYIKVGVGYVVPSSDTIRQGFEFFISIRF
jgi:hypothetical protein